MKKFKAVEHLNDKEYHLFLQVYASHNRSMGLEKRKNYTLSHVTKVKRNIKENCLEVYFVNGDWWKYHVNGTWS